MKKLGILLVILLIGAAGWFLYQQPYAAYQQLRVAAAENDTVRFKVLVDSEQVRAFLQQDLTEAIKDNTSGVPANAFTRFAQSLGNEMLDSLIQPIITPAGIHQLMTQGTLEPELLGLSEVEPQEIPQTEQQPDDLLADAPVVAPSAVTSTATASVALTEEAGYESPLRYKVRLYSEGAVKPVIFTFERDGILSWSLVRIGFGL